MDYMSICMTLKNRAGLLDACLHHLRFQNYDLKKIEICISDGYSTDNISEVIDKWYSKFYQIKYFRVDRRKLPFKELDIFAETNITIEMAAYEKILLIHPEILFIENDELNYVSEELSNNKNILLWHGCYLMKENYKYPYSADLGDFTKGMEYNYSSETHPIGTGAKPGIFGGYMPSNGWCLCFNKSPFIKIEGFSNDSNAFKHKWREYIKEEVKFSKYDVMHLFHPMRSFAPGSGIAVKREPYPGQLKDWPFENPYWHHLKMIKDIKILKK